MLLLSVIVSLCLVTTKIGICQEERDADNSVLEEKELENDRVLLSNKAGLQKQSEKDATIPEIYAQAVQSYLDENWEACIKGFQTVTHKYRAYKNAVISCRRRCRLETKNFKPILWENVEDLNFYEKKIHETLCILKCNQDYRNMAGKNALKKMLAKDEFKIVAAEHHEYLHNCYYKESYYQEAANSLFTYLIYHPESEVSKSTLRQYLELPGVDADKLRNLEAEPFVDDFVEGVRAYENGYFVEAIERLENSLEKFLEAEERCRYYCEGPFEAGWSPEFTVALSNHFVYNLNCKRRCSRLLSTINREYQKDFLPDHYNYLQFAYFKIKQIKLACRAVASFLLFKPSDEVMLENQEYYSKLPNVGEEFFKPRSEAVKYVKRQEYELRLLLFISQEFVDLESTNFEKHKSLNNDFSFENRSEKLPAEAFKILNEEIEDVVTSLLHITGVNRKEIHVAADETILKGKNRFLMDHFLTSSECQLLMYLAKITVTEGAGYDNRKSPHSDHEIFEGVSLGKLAVMTYFGLLAPEFLKLILRVTEFSKLEMEKMILNDQPLYFTYTHLACRTSKFGALKIRSDLSHDIHSDNCLLQNDNSCLLKDPAYFWRDHTSILYLNSNFIGGDFIFVRNDNTSKVESIVHPSCGRMLSFPSNEKNLHGVTAVNQGKRCVIGLWFTYQKKYKESARELAQIVLYKVKNEGAAELTEIPDDKLYEHYEDMLTQRLIRKL